MKLIKINDEVHAELKRRATEASVSMNEIIAQLVNVEFKRPQRGRPNEFADERSTAWHRGENTYMGSPCVHGHSGERYTGSNSCVECHRIRSSIKNPLKEPMSLLIQRQQWMNERDENGAPKYLKYESTVPCEICGNHHHWLKSGLCGDCFTGDGLRISGRVNG